MYSYLDYPCVYLFDYTCPRQVWCSIFICHLLFLFVNHIQIMETMGQFHATCFKISLISRMLKIRTFTYFQKKKIKQCVSLSHDIIGWPCSVWFWTKFREEMARGYMSNAELEIAVHAFGSRCSNISRIYRYIRTWCIIHNFFVTVIFGASKTTLRLSVLLSHADLWILCLIYGILYSAKVLPIMRESNTKWLQWNM